MLASAQGLGGGQLLLMQREDLLLGGEGVAGTGVVFPARTVLDFPNGRVENVSVTVVTPR